MSEEYPELVSISEASRRTGVPATTLRYYDDRGLLPATGRRAGHRVYDRAALRRVAFIRIAQRFEVDLDTIEAMLHGRGPSWSEAAARQVAVLATKEERVRSARRLLEHGQQCPHATPWEGCPYLVRALDEFLETGGDLVMPQPDELADMRRSYERGELSEREMFDDPLRQFEHWMDQARTAGVTEPNAMVLATVDPDGLPSARTVLLKQADESGLVFYTNLDSEKAVALRAHPVAALVFGWYEIERQVRITGAVDRVSREEAEAYFASRPRESQLGAWASRQSSVVPDRESLDRAYAEIAERFPEGSPVPLPEFWGGYRVRPRVYEFWQGRKGRLHDRIRYRATESGDWVKERLEP